MKKDYQKIVHFILIICSIVFFFLPWFKNSESLKIFAQTDSFFSGLSISQTIYRMSDTLLRLTTNPLFKGLIYAVVGMALLPFLQLIALLILMFKRKLGFALLKITSILNTIPYLVILAIPLISEDVAMLFSKLVQLHILFYLGLVINILAVILTFRISGRRRR